MDIFRDWPPKLEPLFSRARYKILKGGRSGGKSHALAELMIYCCSTEPLRCVCLREVQSSIRESVKQLLADKIEAMGLQSKFEVLDQEIRGANGSLIIFKGLQSYNANNIKSLEGMDIGWVEEAQALSHHSWRILRPTIRKPGAEIWASYNPRWPTDAIDEFAVKPPDGSIVIDVSWRDNPHLSRDIRKEIEADYASNPAMAQHVWGGGYEVVSEGAYYGNEIANLERDGRITTVSYDPAVPVYAAFDLGIGDATALWTFQIVGTEWHWLYAYESAGMPLQHYIDVLKALPYKVSDVILPHDAAARELVSGKSRISVFDAMGFSTYLLQQHAIDDGIAAVRNVLPRSWFDADGCKDGLTALRKYKMEFDDRNGVWKSRPVHDAASHMSDSCRYAVMGETMLGGTNRKAWDKPLHRPSNVEPAFTPMTRFRETERLTRR